MTDIEPFRIAVPQSAVEDLHDRLGRVRWPDELPGVGWAYGVPLGYLTELAHYWRHDYDWPAAESQLNAWPQFTTTIDGAQIHFAHIRSPNPDATPLLMIHGWPGSFVEFEGVAAALTDPEAHGDERGNAFHLVIPSIPGFAFSGPTHDTGWNAERAASAFAELMQRLGYASYGGQGGDWGSIILRNLARLHPERLVGLHLNLLMEGNVRQQPTPAELEALGESERSRTLASWEAYRHWRAERSAYSLRGILGADLLRARARRNFRLAQWLRQCPHRARGLPSRHQHTRSPRRRTSQQHRPLDGVQGGRSLRRHGTARSACRRHPRPVSTAPRIASAWRCRAIRRDAHFAVHRRAGTAPQIQREAVQAARL